MNIKDLSITLGVIATLTMAGMSIGVLQSEAKEAKKATEKNEKKIEGHEDEIQELEKFSVKQTILMERQAKILEKLEDKLEK